MTSMKAMATPMTTRQPTVVPDDSWSARTPGPLPDGPSGTASAAAGALVVAASVVVGGRRARRPWTRRPPSAGGKGHAPVGVAGVERPEPGAHQLGVPGGRGDLRTFRGPG